MVRGAWLDRDSDCDSIAIPILRESAQANAANPPPPKNFLRP